MITKNTSTSNHTTNKEKMVSNQTQVHQKVISQFYRRSSKEQVY